MTPIYHFEGPPELHIGNDEAANADLSRLISNKIEWKRKFTKDNHVILSEHNSLFLPDGGLVLGTSFSYYLTLAEILPVSGDVPAQVNWLRADNDPFEITPEARTFGDYFSVANHERDPVRVTGVCDIPIIILPGGRLTDVSTLERLQVWFNKGR